MGTGKTRTYLLSICLITTRLEQSKAAGEEVEFHPSLLVTPVNSLVQTYLETKNCFPDMNIIVFYGQRATFYDKGANVLRMSDLIKHVGALDKQDPQTGRTVVITSYTTLSSSSSRFPASVITNAVGLVRCCTLSPRDRASDLMVPLYILHALKIEALFFGPRRMGAYG